MKRLRIVLVVLIVSLVSLRAEAATPTAGAAAADGAFTADALAAAGRAKPARAGLMLVAGAGHAALLAQDTRFEPRLQLHSSLSGGLGTQLGRLFSVATGLAVEYALASSAAGGYVYPAWTGRTLWLRADLLPGVGMMGARLKVSGVLASYESTFLIFFFPSVSMGPVFRLPLSASAWISADAHVRYQIREDLSIAGTNVPGALLFGVSIEFEHFVEPIGHQ